MYGTNRSVVSEFVFLWITNIWEIQFSLFVFTLLFYSASMIGNLVIVLTVTLDAHLNSPLYFLLANLSVIDMIFCSIPAPKMICDIFKKHKSISFWGCITQIFFSHAVGGTEMVLLIAMAFDRYVAICKPLHYLIIMSPWVCLFFLVTSWVIGLIHSVVQLVFVADLPFCDPNTLDSFYCDLPQLLRLACTNTQELELIVTVNSGHISVVPFFLLVISYIFILFTVWKHSSGGLSKALSTLSAHVIVVILFFWPLMFFYTWPSPTSHLDKYLAIFDAFITPFLNPVIYTFRNKDMKVALGRLWSYLRHYRKMS
ncbi:LOW QUALITY PROTEIN: olfactory receptor 4F15-like [Phodopus roborovskii]|uniref:LOW QUALITY PROTEIN: olfactory receptor 4F15-like n=1 Tax=Phodopus roborovskii TaxID=109678 RepID=UPI0021E48A55|nr:LOW QUALITY PROTEIN: olfactory receptor 4F15-like [Phodopus roborovskii]